jgi:hypothetical protein
MIPWRNHTRKGNGINERYLKEVEGKGGRLNTAIGFSAGRPQKQLAFCYGVTKGALLERVIRAAETVLLAGSSFEEPSADVDKQRHPNATSVTQ